MPFHRPLQKLRNVKVVQRIFGNRIQHVLTNLHIKFTKDTLYMGIDHDGHLLINPEYFETADFTDLYLDTIHELVHVKQVLNGKDCNHQLRYIERPLEIEAYKTAIDEARALGLDQNRILDYLESDLINDDDLRQLATTLELDSQQIKLEAND